VIAVIPDRDGAATRAAPAIDAPDGPRSPARAAGDLDARAVPVSDWHGENQRYLAAAIAELRSLVDGHALGAEDRTAVAARQAAAQRELAAAAQAMSAAPALEVLSAILRLSPFERDVVLLCASQELDATFAAACGRAHGDPRRAFPTFSLALGALRGAHWSALAPSSPLRRCPLVALGAGDAITTCPLRIDERVLHFLAGVPHLDERLSGLVDLVSPPPVALPPSHRAIVDRIVARWTHAGAAPVPVIQLVGPDDDGKRRIAAAAAAAVETALYALPAHALGAGLDELLVSRLLTREAALGPSALLLECDELDASDPRALTAVRLADRTGGLVLMTSRDRRRPGRRPIVVFDVQNPTKGEQRALWATRITAAARRASNATTVPAAPAAMIDGLVAQFDLGAASIEAACEIAADQRDGDPGVALWEACRLEARPRLDDLAQRIEASAGWDDLVLPEPARAVLREIAAQVRQRGTVYERWGFAGKGGRGLGISALFSGASGTGKTMAAEVLARELALDLHRVDLSQTISKYIGETEKNLRRIFDAAEGGAAILLFDEADALFGKRSEVKDSHDRFANIEVSYLLQRMEAYRGLAILTTNLKSALDTAFLRRIRFVVPFAFPDAAQRAEIWRRAFPPEAPTDGLDPIKLARLNVAGGSIRNIAVGAAFLAAEVGEPVRMAHVLRAAEREYAKLERPLNRAELEAP